jgi:hypothetical protein
MVRLRSASRCQVPEISCLRSSRNALAISCMVWSCSMVLAQTPLTSPPSAATGAVAAVHQGSNRSKGATGAKRVAKGPAWASLSAPQKTALAPLAMRWGELSETQKLKWMALSRHFDALPSTEQDRLHSRMTDWAALSVQQRVQARITFAEASALPPAEKRARWEAYQSLSPDERKRLVEESHARPRGAAPAVRPVLRERRAMEHPSIKHGLHGAQVNRATLLPQRPAVRAAAPAARQANAPVTTQTSPVLPSISEPALR